jgi:SAM-dependent methyltransferase
VRSTADLYDWELQHLHHRIDQDVGFYRGLARALEGPVLELACGTGRVAAALVDAGMDVVGLDIDSAMLRSARARGVDRVVQADMRSFAFSFAGAIGRPFRLITVPYNSLQLLLDDESIVACLRCAARHLAGHGLIAFEVTDFGVAGDVEPEVLAEADGVRLIGSLSVRGDVLHYRRRFEEVGGTAEDGADAGAVRAVHQDTVSLRRNGASMAERWVAAAGLTMVSADWSGLGLRVTARTTITP